MSAGPGRVLGFTAAATLLLLGLLEAGARLAGEPGGDGPTAPDMFHRQQMPPYYAPDPLLGWAPRPGAIVDDPVYEAWREAFNLPGPAQATPNNSRGFRDSEPASPRPPAQVRLLCLGDSSVLGVGAAREDTFSERLERALNHPWDPDPAARAVEVFNAGVSGYSSFQSLLQLRANLDLGLDGALVYSQNSEMMEAVGPTDSQIYGRPWAALSRHPLRRLALYRWMAFGITRLKGEAPSGGEHALRVRVEDYRANLRRMVDLSREAGFGLVFIIPPAASDLLEPEPPETYSVSTEAAARRAEAQLAEVARSTDWWAETRRHYRLAMALEGFRAGVPVVDGPRALSEAYLSDFSRYEGADALFADEIHPSGEGHRLLFEATLPRAQALVDGARRP